MSEHESGAVNPGQAIYDALSDEGKAAVDLLPGEVFAGNHGVTAANRFVDLIEAIEALDGNSWSLMYFPKDQPILALSVFGCWIIGRTAGATLMGLSDNAQIGERVRTIVGNHGVDPTVNPAMHMPVILPDNVSIDPGLHDHLLKAQADFVTEAIARRWRRDINANAHRDDWRVHLARITGRHVPPPYYVAKRFLGFSQEEVDAPAWLRNGLTVDAGPLLVGAIRLAHDVHPASWALTGGRNRSSSVHFDVQGTSVLEFHNEGVRIVVPKNWWTQHQADLPARFLQDLKSPHQSVRLEIMPGRLSVDLDAFRQPVGEVVEWLARLTRTQTQRASEHRPELVDQLSELMHEDLPRPTYVTIVSGHGNNEVFQQHATAGLTPTTDGSWTPIALGNIRRHFENAGLTYTDSQIASFYTALQTKGFVILSGISGTGESKIAQRFAEMLPAVTSSGAVGEVGGGSGIPFRMLPYMQRYNRFAIPMKYQGRFPVPSSGESWDRPVVIDGQPGTARIHTSDGTNSNNTWIYFKGASVDHFKAIDSESFTVDLLSDGADGLERIVIRSVANVRKEAALGEPPVISFARPLEPSMKKYRTFVIPKVNVLQFEPPAIGASITVPAMVFGVVGDARIENVRNADTGASRVVRITFRGETASAFDAWEGDGFRVHLLLESDRSVRRVDITPLSSDPDTTTAPPQMLRSNHLFLPVRPDWRDGKALIGYHNPLTGEYRRTPFLDFVLAAAEDYRAGNRNAFFVILDEMNLAHVEYYFADVLSVIESGRDAYGWTLEGIPLDVGEEDADLPEVLRLPPNLYIVGTVNKDETTHPFSPKVLDRAFTIELTDVSFEGYPPVPTDADDGLDDEARQELLEAFTREGRYARIDKAEIRAAVDRHPRLAQDLERLNASLRRYRMHVGYRVFDEVMQFVANAEGNGFFASAEAAFDQAVLMKVLPKFSGSRARLHHPLLDLIHWCRREGVLSPEERGALEAQLNQLATEARSFDAIVPDAEDAEDAWRYPATGRRAALMMQDLAMDGFASFG